MTTTFEIGDKVAVANPDGVEWRATVKYVPSADRQGKRHDPDMVDVMADGTGSVTSVGLSRLRLLSLADASPRRMLDSEPAPVVTDEAVQAAAETWTPFWSHRPEPRRAILKQARAALEAAAPLLGPRPLLHLGDVLAALDEVYTSGAMGGEWPTLGADAVMELARPMPTRDDLVEAISARLHITTDQISTGGSPRQLVADTSAVGEAADAVLALLNGADDGA
jgi:hypothetical protein